MRSACSNFSQDARFSRIEDAVSHARTSMRTASSPVVEFDLPEKT
jgi:hypothetical protein